MKSSLIPKNIPYGRYVLSLISFISISLVLFLSYYPKTNTVEPEWLKVFPTLIATFNAISAGLLIGAYIQLRKKTSYAYGIFQFGHVYDCLRYLS